MAPSKLQKRRNNLIIQMMAYAAAEAAAESTTDVTLTLTWTSGTGTLTPTFTLSGAIVEGDVITLSIYSDSGLTTLVDSDANTVDAAEVLAGVIDFPGIGALSAGTYWAVATLAATGRTGTSNTETKTLVNFTPLSLFSGGEKGFWLDASDLTKMFQLSGGTGAVTADGDPVGYYLDKSGNAHTVTNSSAGQRPLYKTDGSKHWLLFDSSDDVLYNNGVNIGNNVGFLTIAVAIDATSIAVGRDVVRLAVNGNFYNARARIVLDSSNKAYISGRRLDADGDDTATTGFASVAGTPTILIAELDYTNTDGRVYYGSTLQINDTTFTTGGGNTSATDGALVVGENANLKLYQMVIINRQLTTDERNSLGSYMATKSGATF
jgi:hypothetical protein